MLLAFDAGNTNTVLGLFHNGKLLRHWRLSTDSNRTVDEYGLLCRELFLAHALRPEQVDRLIISSVVPDVTDTLVAVGKRYFKVPVLVVGSGIKTGLSIRYDNPKEVGADRIVNAVAGRKLYGAPLILVDFGTATTFCAIDKNGAYLGGAITAGIGISMDALFSHAAKLPKVELKAPNRGIGTSTVEAMQSGLVYGYAALVDGMVERMAKELGEAPEKMMVVATGGRSEKICPHTRLVKKVDPFLTLSGLSLLDEMNRGAYHA